jgi:hypothetical protein
MASGHLVTALDQPVEKITELSGENFQPTYLSTAADLRRGGLRECPDGRTGRRGRAADRRGPAADRVRETRGWLPLHLLLSVPNAVFRDLPSSST